MLVIVLRGALDGLAAVAPVGDPDWVEAARRQGAGARRQDAGAAARFDSSRSIRRCRTCIACIKAGQATVVHAAATPYRERSHFDGQDVLESGARQARRRRHRLAQSRARRARAGRARRSERRRGLCGRAGDAAGGARTGAGAVMDAAAAAAGERRHHRCGCSISIATPIRRWRARWRAHASSPPWRAPAACDRWREAGDERPAAAAVRSAVRAYFAEAAGTAAKYPRPAGWPARRRARFQRLGHARQRRRRQRATGRSARRARRRVRARSRPAWATPGGRPWSPSSPSSAAPRASTAPRAPITAPARSRCWSAARSRAAASSPTGRASRRPICYEKRDLKPTTDLRAVLKGVLKDHLRVDERALARSGVPRQRSRQADGGPGLARHRGLARIAHQARSLAHLSPLGRGAGVSEASVREALR